MTGRIQLPRSLFPGNGKTICEYGKMRASGFTYDSGVHALRIENSRGHIIVLPFQGQQIWDAVFDGRSLRMSSFFPEPVSSPRLLDSYGAFLYHCGALRMGTPGPKDDHPIHGELPAASYDEASLLLGEDEGGAYLAATGIFRHTKAFGDKYRATPIVKMYEDSAILNVDMTIENLAHAPMDLMYMFHVNFLPAPNGKIVQADGLDTRDMVLRSSIPSHVKPTPEYLAFLESLGKNPGVTRLIRPEDQYNPEIVFYVKNLGSDAKGMTHLIQKHPDGRSDYISWDVKSLDHAVRWILMHEDQKVMALALPATCDPEGYTVEKSKGNLRSIPGLGKAQFSLRTGALDPGEIAHMEATIRSL
ncbi:MAG: DUF4432 family protein [Rectinemataceae bacterium]|jgi:hypothetical protein